LLRISRSVVGYAVRKRRDEVELISKIHQLAVHHARYGYRRITVLLRREG